MARLQASLNQSPESAGRQVGLLIGLGVVAFMEHRAKRRKSRLVERWNRRARRYVPLWTMIAALVGVVGLVVMLIPILT